MLESVDIVAQSDGTIEDPLDDEGSIKGPWIDCLSTRAHYQSVCVGLCAYWEENLNLFAKALLWLLHLRLSHK